MGTDPWPSPPRAVCVTRRKQLCREAEGGRGFGETLWELQGAVRRAEAGPRAGHPDVARAAGARGGLGAPRRLWPA